MTATWRWGVPDWRDESAYPSPNDLLLHQWEWEFLRRREDYRETWIHHAHRKLKEHQKFADYVISTGNKKYPRLNTLDEMERFSLGPESEERFGTHFIVDPCRRSPPPGTFSRRGGDSLPWYEHDAHVAENEAGMASVEFDLNKPLRDQVERAQTMLLNLQEEHIGGIIPSRRLRADKWPEYLRVIDARDDGQPLEVIAQVCLKHKRIEAKAAFQVWEQARQVMFNFPR